jgi:hypothetical protein
MPEPVASLARRLLAESAAASGSPVVDGYTRTPWENLLPTLTIGQARRAFADLGGGDGSELKPTGTRPPKVCAAHSSSALAVNVFGAFVGSERELPGGTFDAVRFEQKFPTGLPGRSPNLDVVLSGPGELVAIESKCLEYLTDHEASFQASYDAAITELAHASWQAFIEDVRADPNSWKAVDAGQLIRHYLGLRRAIENGEERPATLLYLFWEPNDAAAHEAFTRHRETVLRMHEAVDDPTVRFRFVSYPELWVEWDAASPSPHLQGHLHALRARYAISF